MEHLDVHVTDSARTVIRDFLSFYEPDSVIGLGYGEFRTYISDGVQSNGAVARWRFVALTPSQAEELDRHGQITGTQGLFNADGVTICLFEPEDVARLRGRTLDAERGKLFVR